MVKASHDDIVAVLQLMKKGTTMLQNIQSLKWFEEYGIRATWNLIAGFPGEEEEDYLVVERLIPLLYHLQPPFRPAFFRIEMERFSPNFDFAEELGFKNVRPKWYYNYIYDVDPDLLRDIVYNFDYELPGFEKFIPHLRRINGLLEEWHRKYYSEDAELSYGRELDFLEVIDRRGGVVTKKFPLRGYDMDILVCCDSISSFDAIMNSLNSNGDAPKESAVLDSIKRLDAQGLILSEGDKYLSLPIARSPTPLMPPSLLSSPRTKGALNMVTKDEIVTVLKDCYDPEIPINIWDYRKRYRS